ncbi:MAG: serine hydrolase [Clostridia bacterium]|nr:serine hydrolase [Clostridia bacterium]
MSTTKAILRAKSPQSAGVSAKVVNEFFKNAKEKGLDYHSLMVIRNGKVAVEWYNEPFDKNTTHSMYSVSKSFTATAVGFAVSEGLISLDDKLLDFFPEYAPENPDERFEKLTIHNLLRMSSGKQPSFLSDKAKVDWIEDYINSPWVFEPGEKFLYINENIFMLSAIVNKVTGMSMREYLRPRLFEPLGIDFPFWETDRNGIEAGGWGLYLKTEDLAKVMLCYLKNGKYKGEQVIPAEWVHLASSKQIDNEYNRPGTDSSYGYGYCFWLDHLGGYRADGMFSQFGIVFPQHNAVVVVNSSITEEQAGLDGIFEFFPRAFEEADEDTELEANSSVPPVLSVHPAKEQEIQDRYIKFRKKILLNLVGFQVSVLPLAVTYMMSDKAGNIDMVKFDFNGEECTFRWSEGNEHNKIQLGMDGHYRYSTMTLGQIEFKVCANASWIDDETLLVSIRPIQTVGKRNMVFNFRANDKVVMTPSSTPYVGDILATLGGFFDQMIPIKPVCEVFKKVVQLLPPLVEPKHYGKFIEGIKKR